MKKLILNFIVASLTLVSQSFANDGVVVGSFGYQDSNDGVIVDEFGMAQQYDLLCESNGYNYNECYVSGQIRNAWVVAKHSKSNCIQGSSWGFHNNVLWVNNGCRATFRVVISQPQTRDVLCESHNYQYATCYVGGYIRFANIVRKHSKSACNYGQSWGYNGNVIWVDRGCRATFRVQIQ